MLVVPLRSAYGGVRIGRGTKKATTDVEAFFMSEAAVLFYYTRFALIRAALPVSARK